jgi:hypothetical protein
MISVIYLLFFAEKMLPDIYCCNKSAYVEKQVLLQKDYPHESRCCNRKTTLTKADVATGRQLSRKKMLLREGYSHQSRCCYRKATLTKADAATGRLLSWKQMLLKESYSHAATGRHFSRETSRGKRASVVVCENSPLVAAP